MTAGGGDIFDGLVTPTATAAAAAAGAAGAAAAFQRPDSVPPLNTAALKAAGATGSAAAPATGATGTTFYSAQGATSGAPPSERSAFQSARSGLASGRSALPSGRPSDVFDFVQTPMHSSRAGAAPAALAAGVVAAGVAAGAVAAAAAGSAEERAAAEEAQPGAVDVAARRPGFRLDVNDLAEDSVSGERLFVGVCAACWEGAVVVWPRALCLSGEAVVCVRETACWLAAQAPRWHAWGARLAFGRIPACIPTHPGLELPALPILCAMQ